MTWLGTERDCPACGKRKVIPRKQWPGVSTCYGCGRTFIDSSMVEVDPVEGPRAFVNEGRVVLPFVPGSS